MKKKIQIPLVLLSILVSAIACEKDANADDNTTPTISEIIINRNDTINVAAGDVIYLNADDAEPLVIPMGHYIVFGALLEDNKSLSNYKLVLDTLPNMQVAEGDTVHPYTFGIYGGPQKADRDTLIVKKRTFKIDSLASYRDDDITKYKRIQEGIYKLSIHVVDRAGNEAVAVKQVHLRRRENIIADRE